MNKLSYFLILGFLLSLFSCGTKSIKEINSSIITDAKFDINWSIDSTHKDCKDIQFGFEGGDLKKIDGVYHLFTSERQAEPVTINNRLAHWQSKDSKNWERVSSLFQFDLDTSGNIPNSCLYNPKLVFSEVEKSWYLFYIQFKSNPSLKNGWHKRYDGQVMLSKSAVLGKNGIGGPYNKGQVVFKIGKENTWEGLQGITGFSPYEVNGKWYALYGSANTEEKPCKHWRLGLATASSLDEQWKPVRKHALDLPIQAECPQVVKYKDQYLALIDEIGGEENFSIITSNNGIDWKYNSELKFIDHSSWKWKEIRSPIGFLLDRDVFKSFFSTYYKNDNFAPIRQVEFSINTK